MVGSHWCCVGACGRVSQNTSIRHGHPTAFKCVRFNVSILTSQVL